MLKKGPAMCAVVGIAALFGSFASRSDATVVHASGEVAPRLASPLHRSPDHEQIANGFTIPLELAAHAYATLRRHERITLTDFILPARTRHEPPRLVAVQLDRMHVLSDTAAVVASDPKNPAAQRNIAAPDVALLRGRIAAQPQSRVFLSIAAHGAVHGYVVEDDGTVSVISSGPHQTDLPVLVYNISELDRRGAAFASHQCMINPTTLREPPQAGAVRRGHAVIAPCRRIALALEAGFDYTADFFDGDADAAAAYALTLAGAATEMFSESISIEFEVVHLGVLDGPGGPTTLNGFRDHWEAHMTHIDRDLAHLLTSNSFSVGAYFQGLCSNELAYGATPILNGFFPSPLEDFNEQNWDPITITHEIAHNLGSPHTHNFCPPLDRCATSGGGLPAPCADEVICQPGTIMSYCQGCGKKSGNIALSFHPVVQTTMLDYLDTLESCGLEHIDECEVTAPMVVHVPHDVASIQQAIWTVADGGEVVVHPGTYSEQPAFAWSFSTFDFPPLTIVTSKAMTIRSIGGPEATVIDGAPFDGSVLAIANTGGANIVIDGFTITGGSAERGGGAYVEEAAVIFSNCIFLGNTARSRGGAVDALASEVTFIDCAFEGNSSTNGGALHVESGQSLSIDGCRFVNNTASHGGAIFLNSAASPTLISSTLFEQNTASLGGGAIGQAWAEIVIKRSVFRHNAAGNDGGAIRNIAHEQLAISETRFCENQPTAIAGSWDDLGGNAFDAFCQPADLNADGVVDVADLLMLLSAWGACADCEACSADLTENCSVGVDDLLTLLANWG